MEQTERVEITAKTFDEAIAIALDRFQTTRDRLIVRTVEEGSKGLFGLGARDAKIVVSLKKDIPEEPALEAASSSAKQDEAPAKQPSAAKDVAAAGQRAADFVSTVISQLSLDCSVTFEAHDDHAKVIVTGADVGTVIGRRGETLDALQYLTNLYTNKEKRGDSYVRILLDTENYRAKREETLIRLANSTASKAIKYRKDVSLEPMNPYERRIIHSALQGRPGIKTRSVGDEPNRRIVVCYKR